MFTGIVRELGRVVAAERRRDALRLVVQAAAREEIGASVAIDGCCLTVVENGNGSLAFDLSPETLDRSTLGSLAAGDAVNVEPALRAGEPLGGHFVQGHVDGVGRVRAVEPEGEGVRLWLELPPDLHRYVVEKGSLTVAGVSLTAAARTEDAVAVALIPHTLEVTTLGALAPGDRVNVEVDLLAKLVDALAKN